MVAGDVEYACRIAGPGTALACCPSSTLKPRYTPSDVLGLDLHDGAQVVAL